MILLKLRNWSAVVLLLAAYGMFHVLLVSALVKLRDKLLENL